VEPASEPEEEPEEEPASEPEEESEEEPASGPEPEVDSEAQPKIEAEPASERESEPAPVPDPAPTPDPAPATKNYHVQIRAYQDEAAASDYANSLQQAGYPVKVISFVDAKGRQWFRIRVTGFKSKTAAKEFSKDFNLRNNEQSVVVEVQ
jgi:cell division protein FtsN